MRIDWTTSQLIGTSHFDKQNWRCGMNQTFMIKWTGFEFKNFKVPQKSKLNRNSSYIIILDYILLILSSKLLDSSYLYGDVVLQKIHAHIWPTSILGLAKTRFIHQFQYWFRSTLTQTGHIIADFISFFLNVIILITN